MNGNRILALGEYDRSSLTGLRFGKIETAHFMMLRHEEETWVALLFCEIPIALSTGLYRIPLAESDQRF
jgi:hypothetical protein